MYSLLLILMVVAVSGVAILGALLFVGFAIYRARTKTNGNPPAPPKVLDPDQADEITATWHILNP